MNHTSFFPRPALALLALAAALSVAACDRNDVGPQQQQAGTPSSDVGTTGGSPAPAAHGNPTQLAQPQAPDGPPGGPSGVKGSMAHPGASGGDVMPGTWGRGTEDAGASGTQVMGNRSQPAQGGVGLNGGLGGTVPPGATTSSMQSGVAPRGSPAGSGGTP